MSRRIDPPMPSPDDPGAWEAWCQQQERLAAARVEAAVRELQARGLVDEQGKPQGDALPADMQADSKASVATG